MSSRIGIRLQKPICRVRVLKGLRPIFIKRGEEKYSKLRGGARARRRARI